MAYITQLNKQSIAAAKLAYAVDIALGKDASGTVSFDGSESVTIDVTLQNSATARSDLGLGSVATLDTGVAAGNVPVLGSDGKLATDVLPALALTDVFVKTDIVGATEAAAKAAMETWVLSLDAQVGDVAVYTYSWPETTPYTGSISGTLIKAKESTPSVIGDWTAISTPTQAQLDALTSRVNAHIGAVGTDAHGVATTSAAGFLPALSGTATNVLVGDGTYVDHIGLGGNVHAGVSTTAAGFIPALPTDAAAAKKFFAGNGQYVEHVGLGGNVHKVADTTEAGFMPALSADGAAKYLNGAGQWANVSDISALTIIPTTGATAGQLTLVGDHIGVAKSATEVYASGVVSFGSGLVAGKAVFVEQTSKTVVYGDLSTAEAGTYNQIGVVVAANKIAIAFVQPVYTVA